MENKTNSLVGKLSAERKKNAEEAEKIKEQALLVAKMINDIAQTPIGKIWLKMCYNISEFGKTSEDINVNLLQRKEALRYMYVKCFRNFFTAETLKKIEANNYSVEDEDFIEE